MPMERRFYVTTDSYVSLGDIQLVTEQEALEEVQDMLGDNYDTSEIEVYRLSFETGEFEQISVVISVVEFPW